MKKNYIAIIFYLLCLTAFGICQECTTSDNRKGLCNYEAECSTNYNPDGYGCGVYYGYQLICCPWQTTQTPSQPATFSLRSSSVKLPQPGECGTQLAYRIFGGEEALIDEHPWMALIEHTKPENGRRDFHCAGSIINENYVLTAAHCIKNLRKNLNVTGVRLGEFDLRTDPDSVDAFDENVEQTKADPVQNIRVVEHIIHEDYNLYTLQNDIALLRLEHPARTTDFIRPVCLPSNANNHSFHDGEIMEICGWGRTEDRAYSPIKMRAEVDAVSLDTCSKKYQESSQISPLTNKQICAGGHGGVDTCKGDSGGPLLIKRRNGNGVYYYLVGIVSLGPAECGQDGWPGVYTRVDEYMPWIRSKIRA
ncbi:serine protease easter-like isoform X2 [Contarinia nasturtii]|uniref:serine protease easter-like isoform X2 n=1 Tax=Contarinia nasturtii TaxID=265458 RepID=UPI0012D4C13A|nr:serine protease easter-like isoform X2 [Contarinia nasturtii]